MWSFLFGNRKKDPPKTSSPSSQSIDFLTDSARTPGDIETYIFVPTLKHVEYSYRSWTPGQSPPSDSSLATADSVDLENEKVISELMSKYSQQQASPGHDKGRKLSNTSSEGSDEASMMNLKSLNESLKRIARYNNKRKYDERLGFASTLAAKAEEIGRNNTVKFLLKVIDEQLVCFRSYISPDSRTTCPKSRVSSCPSSPPSLASSPRSPRATRAS